MLVPTLRQNQPGRAEVISPNLSNAFIPAAKLKQGNDQLLTIA